MLGRPKRRVSLPACRQDDLSIEKKYRRWLCGSESSWLHPHPQMATPAAPSTSTSMLMSRPEMGWMMDGFTGPVKDIYECMINRWRE